MRGLVGYAIGITSAFLFAIVLLLTSVDIAVFSNLNFFKDQYQKNGVYSVIDIDESQLMNVTNHLLNYMKDEEENLDVTAIVSGRETQFFNKDEKDHMIDVKNLVLKAMDIRNYAVIYILISIAIIYFFKLGLRQIFSRSIIIVFSILAIALGVFSFTAYGDFYGVFIKFHEMLFTNDLWILDPDTDRLVNIVPEEFFFSVTFRIVKIFIISVLISVALAIISLKHKDVKVT